MIPVLIGRIIGAMLTLYMLALMLRWLGPFIDFNLDERRYLRWIPRLTDPYLAKVKEIVPSLGLANIAAPIAILAVWVLRIIVVGQ